MHQTMDLVGFLVKKGKGFGGAKTKRSFGTVRSQTPQLTVLCRHHGVGEVRPPRMEKLRNWKPVPRTYSCSSLAGLTNSLLTRNTQHKNTRLTTSAAILNTGFESWMCQLRFSQPH